MQPNSGYPGRLLAHIIRANNRRLDHVRFRCSRTKGCRCCGEKKEIGSFGKDNSRKDGHYVYCKECCAEKRRKYAEYNKVYQRKRYKERKEKYQRKKKQYYEENKEKILEESAKRYVKNRKRYLETNKAWQEKNREKCNQIKRNWKKRNPKRTYSYVVERRMRLRNQIPEGTDLEAVRKFSEGCPPGMEVDHIIPISKGGLHCVENLQYLTPEENRRKYNKVD